MNTKLFLSTILGCSVLAFTLAANAQGTSNSTQKYTAAINLTPTPDGPAKAKGSAHIASKTINGERTSNLLLQTQGLEPGDYSVNGVLASDGSTVVLAEQFTVITTGKNKTKSKSKIILSSDLDVVDVVEVIILNSDGVAVLQGDLASKKSSATLEARVPVIAGDAAPGARGSAKLKSSIKGGKRKDAFTMTVSGVPENAVFTVNVDGTDAGSAKSNRQGTVTVKKLPAGLTEIQVVSLVDEAGGEVARAEF